MGYIDWLKARRRKALSLLEHDRIYHHGRYDGGPCRYRDMLNRYGKANDLRRADEEHAAKKALDFTVSLFEHWTGKPVEWEKDASALDDAADGAVRTYIKPSAQRRLEQAIDDYVAWKPGMAKSGTVERGAFTVISDEIPPLIKACLIRGGMKQDNSGIDETDFNGVKFCISPRFIDHATGRNKAGTLGDSNSVHVTSSGGIVHVHDMEPDELKKLLKALDDPIMVIGHGVDGKHAIRFVTDLKEQGKEGYCFISVLFNDKPETIQTMGAPIVEVLSASVYEEDEWRKPIRWAEENNEIIYANTKRRGAILRDARRGQFATGSSAKVSPSSAPLTENDFPKGTLGIIAESEAAAKGENEESDKKYREAYFRGDYDEARRIMTEYAASKGFRLHWNKKAHKTEFVNADGTRKKSDEFEFSEGDLVPLSERFITDMPYGFEKDYLEGKDTKGARQFAQYYRSFKDRKGDVAGWYDLRDGHIHLVKGKADAKTVCHEAGWHATFDWAKKNEPELHREMVQYAKDAPESVKRSVRERYGDIGEEELIDEIGAERFTQEHVKGILDEAEKGAVSRWFGNVKRGIGRIWRQFTHSNGIDAKKIVEAGPKKGMEELVRQMLGKHRLPIATKSDARKPRSAKEMLIDLLADRRKREEE